MAVTIEGEVTGSIGTGGGTVTIPGTPQENDIVLLSRVCDNALDAATISEVGYNEIAQDPANSNPGRSVAWKRMGASPDSSITVGGEGTFAQSYICRLYRDVDTSTAVDNTPAHSSGASGTPDCASYTTITNGARRVLIGFLDDDSVTATEAPTGYGSLATSNNTGRSLMQAERDEATAGADDPGLWTTAGNDEWYAIHFAWRPATGGGGVTGTIAQTLPKPTQAASGVEIITGTAAQTLPKLTQAASGTAIQDATGEIAQTLPGLEQAAEGTVTAEGVAGSIAQTLPRIIQAAAGTALVAVTGTIDQILPKLRQAASGTGGDGGGGEAPATHRFLVNAGTLMCR